MKKCKAWTYRIFRNTQRHLSLGLSCLCISLTNFEIWAEMQSRENRFIIVSFPPLQKLLQAAWQHHWRHERNRKRFISGLINRCEHTSTQTKPRVQSRGQTWEYRVREKHQQVWFHTSVRQKETRHSDSSSVRLVTTPRFVPAEVWKTMKSQRITQSIMFRCFSLNQDGGPPNWPAAWLIKIW